MEWGRVQRQVNKFANEWYQIWVLRSCRRPIRYLSSLPQPLLKHFSFFLCLGSNPIGVYCFYTIKFFGKNKRKIKRGRGWPIYKIQTINHSVQLKCLKGNIKIIVFVSFEFWLICPKALKRTKLACSTASCSNLFPFPQIFCLKSLMQENTWTVE